MNHNCERRLGTPRRRGEKAKPADLLSASIAENVRLAAHRLETASPILSEYVTSGKVKVVGTRYDLATGKIALL
ncbi:carbonic anhydrase [Ciceribacter lividus]|uniref:carbonic anhydrase n=1 Tax=Ciceribacter lividus TaxID=1197950 RepID=UPI003CCAF649